MQCVIMAGGRGTRLAPLTDHVPKVLLPVMGCPYLTRLLEQLAAQECSEAVLCLGEQHQAVRSFVQAHISTFPVPVRWSVEDEPLGTAGPLSLVSGLDETFLIINCDVLTTLNFERLWRFHQQQAAALTIASRSMQAASAFGRVVAENGAVSAYREKQTLESRVAIGVYVMQRSVVKRFLEPSVAVDLPDLLKSVLAADETVLAYETTSVWHDLGQLDTYLAAQDENQLAEPLRTQLLEKRPEA